MREGWIPVWALAWALTGSGFGLVHPLLASVFALSGGPLGFHCSVSPPFWGWGEGWKSKGCRRGLAFPSEVNTQPGF